MQYCGVLQKRFDDASSAMTKREKGHVVVNGYGQACEGDGALLIFDNDVVKHRCRRKVEMGM
jgi:hypothetical protein